ncbi:MAG: glycosyltransferase [Cyclobacteriaceae bacterium]|nr:glycosyltransferase [Cyclobacteriaceae bacterium]
MKKRRIVLASILKPVDDTRMVEKLGVSLAKFNGQVSVIGYPSTSPSAHDTITRVALKPYMRLSLGRVLAPLHVLLKCIKVKPELLIVNTHELLLVAIAIRILFGCKIVYDIQENYALNLKHTAAFPVVVRPVLAAIVRLKETLTAPFFHAFLLAEKCYADQLSFVRNKAVVLENKVVLQEGFRRLPQPGKIRLLFTGTIAESTGVFQAIDLTEKLHAVNSNVELEIMGFCALPATLSRIRQRISGLPFVTLIGGERPVPHSRIFEAIRHASFGLIYYPPAPHIASKVPTKLYEYLGCRLPILLQPVPGWLALAKPSNGALAVDFQNPDAEEILTEITSRQFCTGTPTGVTWDEEEARLLQWVVKIFV